MMIEIIKRIFPIEVNYEIKNFAEYFKKRTVEFKKSHKKKIVFMDSASYNNIGDQAIAYAIRLFIEENFSEYDYYEITEKNFLRNYNYLKKYIVKDDIICLSGGGNMGDLYPKYEAIRRKIIKNFKNNRIIIFPQTIDYGNNKYGNKELKKSIKIYNSNSNLVVCAREEISYNTMRNIYKNVKFVPDIVLYLCKRVKIDKRNSEKNIGICLRKDKESVISETLIRQITDLEEKTELTTMSEIDEINENTREEILMSKLNEFANCKIIVTDRLHGMIFAILSNTPCIAFDNSNKKVSGVYNTVKEYLNNVMIGNSDNIDLKRETDRLEQENNRITEDTVDKLYSELKECFK